MKRTIPRIIIPGASAFMARVEFTTDGQGSDDSAAGGDEDQQERAPGLAEQAPELETGVVEVRLAPA